MTYIKLILEIFLSIKFEIIYGMNETNQKQKLGRK